MEKFRVGIIGATGMVGQRFVLLTANHPWFTPVVLAASAHSAGKTYAQAIEGKWHMAEPIPESVKSMIVMDAEADAEEIARQVDFVFCAVNMKKEEIREFAKIASGLGMAVLGEAHTEAELEILLNCPEIPLLGINARDLRTFETDLERTYQLIQMIPRDRFPIAESAIRSHEDIARLQGVGAAGFLIGETLMRAEHPGEKLRELIG